MANEKVTEELLKNIKTDDEFNISDLSKLFCKRVVGVRLSTGRGRMVIKASDRVLGISKKANATAEEFRKKSVKAGNFLFFDEKIIKNFDNLFTVIRQAMTRYSISKEGSTYYMTMENYYKFSEYFEKTYLPKFEEQKKSLIANIDDYKSSFKSSLESWLTETVDDDKDRTTLLTYYISKFPTAEEFKTDCNLELLLSAYPIVQEDAFNGVNVEIANKLKNSSDQATIDTLYTMVVNNLAEAYKITEKMISTIDVQTSFDGERLLNLNMGSRTKGLLNQTIELLRNNNYLLKNDTINDIIFLLDRIFIQKKDINDQFLTNNEAVEISEKLLAGIYGYASHLDKIDDFAEQIKGSNYDLETLEILSGEIELSDL